MWRNLTSRAILDRPVLRVETHIRRRDDGLEREFLVLSAPDWVNIIPVTSRGRVVLIRQWRHGVNQTALEIPGGMVDPGESPVQAAARELLEETGHRAGKLEDLGWVHPNPALFGNRCHTFLARDCRRVQAQRTEDDEEIELV
jgi:8-oxo-dGTP pyrophosphatase MutT (NUDIX family)